VSGLHVKARNFGLVAKTSHQSGRWQNMDGIET
jgi:hypothetical protein